MQPDCAWAEITRAHGRACRGAQHLSPGTSGSWATCPSVGRREITPQPGDTDPPWPKAWRSGVLPRTRVPGHRTKERKSRGQLSGALEWPISFPLRSSL